MSQEQRSCYTCFKLVSSCLNNTIKFALLRISCLGTFEFTGPGTKLKERLARGECGINRLVALARAHDFAYNKSNSLTDRHRADEILENQTWEINEVWQVFTKDAHSIKVICQICFKQYINSGSNTINLWNHLKFIELDRLRRGVSSLDVEVADNDDEYIDETNLTQTSSNSEIVLNPSTSSLDQSFVFDSHTPAPSTVIEELSSKIINKQTKMTQFTLNKTSKMKIDNALTYFIATSMAPYNVVEKEVFKLFVNALNPSYKLPSRKTVTEFRIPNLYIETRNSIGKIINRANYLSITTDCWTLSSNKPFIAMTCHFNTNFKLDVACLGCIELSEDHTGENISDVLQMFILDYEIPDWKICPITTDHGSNMLKAVNNLSIPHLDCFDHVLNIGVSVILNLDSVKDVLNKVKSIHNIFAHSWKAVREMEIVQERFSLPKKKFPSYSKTRRWSILELINVIIDQDLGLTSFLRAYKNGNYTNLIFQETDITDNLAGDSYVTGSAILPIVSSFKWKLSKVTEQTAAMDLNRSLIQNMYSAIIILYYIIDRRLTNNTTLMICSTLDPRFKIEYIAHDNLSELKTKIVELCEINLKKVKMMKHLIEEIFITLKMKIESELNLYLTIPKCNFEQEPLEWWNMNKDTYPMLSLLAEKSLTVQATNVASERVFSKGGCILTDLRSSLSNEHASQLIYLSMNKDYVPKPIF
ncbi:hypothetical protein QTP88_029059 [Uroleucon formosanum]